ncbi:MAG TPA: MaoC family dehydratase [Bryobacteraceae bacterium]|nr:MaoC family dehydratase [Bryobacteraceae bacterium]
MTPTRTLTLDELHPLIGQEVAVSPWFQITQHAIDTFAEVSGDHQWIHVDVERARRESRYGGAIAHGFLTLSLLSHLSREAVNVQTGLPMRVNYGLNRVRFPSPVPAGSRVRAHFTPQSVSESEIVWLVTMELEGAEKPALVAEWITRYYR